MIDFIILDWFQFSSFILLWTILVFLDWYIDVYFLCKQWPSLYSFYLSNKWLFPLSYLYQGCQFRFISLGMTETFHTNSKNETKRNNFHLILNLGPFWIFRLNSGRNVPVSFHMFRSALEKPLNQIESCSI
jgi:hypothetical protein